MRRVIDGKSYDTDTAVKVAVSEPWDDDDRNEVRATLYRTKGGAFFTVYRTEREDVNEEPEYIHSFETMTRDEAHKWVMGEAGVPVELRENVFGEEPPEAEAEKEEEADPITMVSYRIPISLKREIDFAAKAAGESANTWVTKCLAKASQILKDVEAD